MIRWGHGHSLGTGALLALALLHGNYLWTLSAVLLAGVALGRGWWAVGRLMRSVADRLRLHPYGYRRPW